jgi:hypothetical protein
MCGGRNDPDTIVLTMITMIKMISKIVILDTMSFSQIRSACRQ